MNKKLFFLILTIPMLILIAGCAPKCTVEEIASFVPILESPPNGSEVSYNNLVTFDWTHNQSCMPEKYEIVIGEKLHSELVDGETSKYDYYYAFIPGKQYEWFVRGAVKDENNKFVYGPPSETWTVTADGLCSSAAELAQPFSTHPLNGELLGEGEGPGPGSVDILWQYSGDCFADSYHYQVAADPGFTNIITSGTNIVDNPREEIFVPWCAKVYWRVQAVVRNDGGEYSEPSHFTYTSSSNCFENQTSTDPLLIKGYVFEDYCGSTVPWVPDGVGITPPCVFGEPYGVHADGVRARADTENEMTGDTDPAETGISDVVVDLGEGPCPSTGLDQFTSTKNGNYYFMVQSPGEYCLSIDKANNPDLDHGIWTSPLTDQDVTGETITFNPGDDLVMQNFGWDKNDFMKIDFWVDLTSFCRFGDSKYHQAVTEVQAGKVIPIFARNKDATWFATYVNGMRCFISVASGAPKEDPTELMIFPVQADPRPTVDPNGSTGDTNRPTVDPCANNASQRDCIAAGCLWHPATLSPGYCSSD
jgi:hypothetical protein